MIISDPTKLKIFEVQVSCPPAEGRPYSTNAQAFVATYTAQRAITLALLEYPGASVWSVVHRGSYTTHKVIIDPEAK